MRTIHLILLNHVAGEIKIPSLYESRMDKRQEGEWKNEEDRISRKFFAGRVYGRYGNDGPYA